MWHSSSKILAQDLQPHCAPQVTSWAATAMLVSPGSCSKLWPNILFSLTWLLPLPHRRIANLTTGRGNGWKLHRYQVLHTILPHVQVWPPSSRAWDSSMASWSFLPLSFPGWTGLWCRTVLVARPWMLILHCLVSLCIFTYKWRKPNPKWFQQNENLL